MIDPTTSWFETVELPVTDDLSHTGTKKNITGKEKYKRKN
jgi:hypothetical protein